MAPATIGRDGKAQPPAFLEDIEVGDSLMLFTDSRPVRLIVICRSVLDSQEQPPAMQKVLRREALSERVGHSLGLIPFHNVAHLVIGFGSQ